MKCRKTFDARSLTHDALEQLRVATVKRVESGESPEFVAAGLGLNRRTIYRWLTAFHYGGEAALKAKAIPGKPPKLGPAQVATLARIIRDKNPLQFKFEYALWTLPMIRELIRDRFAVALSEVSVGRLMRRIGFTPQRPLYRAWQQDPEAVERWRAEEYPKIAARARREGAVIFFEDESGVRSDHHAGTTWAPRGQTPVVKATGARYGFNMISAVNAQGHFRFMLLEGRVTAGVFIEFLERLLHGMDRKVFLVVDGHPTHKARSVQRFIAANAARIELFVLLPYSPELNPDELAWAHVKSHIGRAVSRTKDELKTMVHSVLRRLQRRPEIVSSFLHAPTCAYAAG